MPPFVGSPSRAECRQAADIAPHRPACVVVRSVGEGGDQTASPNRHWSGRFRNHHWHGGSVTA